jgi:hypothetical protein
MTAIRGERLSFGQRSGPDVELVVFGDEFYARYETPEGYSAVHDDARGLFCYAHLVDGAFVSSGVPVTAPPPPGAVLHGKESDAVRQARRGAARARKFPSQTTEGGSHERNSR